jgi:hypothetical protein
MKAPVLQPFEQLRYALWLDWGARIGLAALVALFFAYATGILEPLVPHERLPEVWQLPATQYVEATAMPTGWHWLSQVQRGDVANMIGIALLAGCSLPALLVVLPLYVRRGERHLAWVGAAEIAVLLLAASGMLTAGH